VYPVITVHLNLLEAKGEEEGKEDEVEEEEVKTDKIFTEISERRRKKNRGR